MPTPHLPSPIAVEEIFRVAAALPAAERAAYLEATCEGQPAVRARVERMLEVGGIAALLQHSADETVPLEIEADLARWKPEEGGERIGNYKLLQQIGQGGFGIVWMAEQIEPVRRRVALKIIKLGMDTKEVIARFEQERQALAMMDHPNIAKVFDAGVTPTGRPFFVMELVRGIKITEYCDQANLSTAERLALFIAVCHAVQHAHQKGIIHRDLKPSNILVTLHDGVPVPKVIDFGVAKATQSERLTDLTFFTQFEQMIGTPLYMSPEQAEMSGLDIDTRSDIYSLGVLLYELLAGRTPFDPQELIRKGLDEIRRAIREQEPPKPSTALHTMAAAARTTIAQHRQADGAKLMGLIRGDLDWIVMKALEKDRTRRYETANGLAADLKRHLSHEPVLACPPSAKYRLQKAFGRNKLLFTSAGAVAIALVLGMLVSSWQMLVARRARQGEAEQRDQATARLFDSLVGQARATRIARKVGYREEVFDLLRKARDLRVAEKGMADLRREAAACMGDFVGLRPRKILSALTHNSLERVQLSKDGHLLAVQDIDGTVRLCDLPSGRELGRWKTGGWKTGGDFRGFVFNGASDQLLSVHVPAGTDQTFAQGGAVTHFMMLSRTQSGQWVQSASGPLPGAVTCVTVGESLLAVVADTWPPRELRLVQPETGRVLQRFTRTEGRWSGVFALSPDGRFFAAEVESSLEAGKGALEVWDVARQRLIKSLEPQQWGSLAFSQDSIGFSAWRWRVERSTTPLVLKSRINFRVSIRR
ncbi:MAG: serine/threonine-protein kinase [Verrucomicrobiales bacterium]|nr:serine/threonine-protein kinase [Verrucomicrobiales bacterium]